MRPETTVSAPDDLLPNTGIDAVTPNGTFAAAFAAQLHTAFLTEEPMDQRVSFVPAPHGVQVR